MAPTMEPQRLLESTELFLVGGWKILENLLNGGGGLKKFEHLINMELE